MGWLFPVIAVTALASFRGFKDRKFLERWTLIPYRVHHGKEWLRVVTHGFIHADATHLLLNMFVLWNFGGTVETALRSGELVSPIWGASNRWTFPLLYFGGLLAASFPALQKHRDNPRYASLGASGAVSAVLMTYILMYPDHRLLLFLVIPMPAVLAGVVFFVYESHMNRRGRTGVAHDAHLNGAAFGAVLALIYEPNLLPEAFQTLRQTWLSYW